MPSRGPGCRPHMHSVLREDAGLGVEQHPRARPGLCLLVPRPAGGFPPRIPREDTGERCGPRGGAVSGCEAQPPLARPLAFGGSLLLKDAGEGGTRRGPEPPRRGGAASLSGLWTESGKQSRLCSRVLGSGETSRHTSVLAPLKPGLYRAVLPRGFLLTDGHRQLAGGTG